MSGTQTTIVLVAAVLSLAATTAAIAWYFTQHLGARIDTLGTGLGARIDDLHSGLNLRIDDLRSDMGAHFGEVNARLDRIEDRVTHLERQPT